jgi:hypothetical protein
MSTVIKLDSALVESARIYASAAHRSTPKQMEHWAVDAAPELTHVPTQDCPTPRRQKSSIGNGCEE